MTPHSPLLVPERFWRKFADANITLLAGKPAQEEVRFTRAAGGTPAPGVWTFSALFNPERMRSLSPGLRAARYPGWAMGWGVNPERVGSFVPFTGVNPTHTVRRMRVRTASAIAGTHLEKTVCTRILANDCGMAARMDRSGR
jgi:hypothetical protein